jgi:hypothetical protein
MRGDFKDREADGSRALRQSDKPTPVLLLVVQRSREPIVDRGFRFVHKGAARSGATDPASLSS